MGFRKDKVYLSRVKFEIIPELLANRLDVSSIYGNDPDAQDIQSIYTMCHKTVFGNDGGPVGKDRDKIVTNAAVAEVQLRLFILANMIGWRETHAGQEFYAKALIGEPARKRVLVYSDVCRKKFGTFDSKSLDSLTGGSANDDTNLNAKMLNSEIVAGSWIVGYKRRRGSSAIKSLYRNKELDLDPHWLAIEESYSETIIAQHLKKPFGNVSENRHRFTVTQIIGELKRKPTKAVHVFNARQNIMPKALMHVIGGQGFALSDFEAPKSPVTNAFQFWRDMGLAMQHVECMRYLDGDPTSFITQEVRRQTLPD